MIISVTMDFGLDHSITYSGGLGVLEADKYYWMAEAGIPYTVLTLFYRKGYVHQARVNGEILLEGEDLDPRFIQSLHPEPDMEISLNGKSLFVKPLVHPLKQARAVFFEVVCPPWARALTDRIYIEPNAHFRLLKNALLARCALEYVEQRIGWDTIEYFDLQEAKGALCAGAIPLEKLGFTTHTPGPWGHPIFSHAEIQRALPDWVDRGLIPNLIEWPDPINLTEYAMAHAQRIFTVSQKHATITRTLFPKYADRIQAATNGVYLPRWQHPAIKQALDANDFQLFVSTREQLRHRLLERFQLPDTCGPIFLWHRRITRYKRPYFIHRFVEDHPDLPAVFVLAGRPHPQDNDGIEFTRRFYALADRHPHVFYLENYNLEIARFLVQHGDIMLFTPFPGWEACGTSFMKAGVNGVPTLSSRDGGALEMIVEGQTGWFFGHELDELLDFYNDDRAHALDEQDYEDFKDRCLQLTDLFLQDREHFYRIAFETAQHFSREADIHRTLKTLYPNLKIRL